MVCISVVKQNNKPKQTSTLRDYNRNMQSKHILLSVTPSSFRHQSLLRFCTVLFMQLECKLSLRLKGTIKYCPKISAYLHFSEIYSNFFFLKIAKPILSFVSKKCLLNQNICKIDVSSLVVSDFGPHCIYPKFREANNNSSIIPEENCFHKLEHRKCFQIR